MSETLRRLGLEADSEEHPADNAVLKMLGLAPEKDEHPATAAEGRDWGGSIPVTPENRGTPAPQPSTLQRVHEAIDPSRVLPAVASDVGGNILEHAAGGASQVSKGLSQLTGGEPASGVGNVAMGGLRVPMSLLTGPVKSGENALASITGNPDFADKAAMMFPMRVGAPVASTATHSMKPSTKAMDLVAERMTPEQLERLRSNPRLRPMDVSKGVRDLGVGIAKDTSQPRAMAPVVSSMEKSAASAKDAVRGTYNETLGTPPNLYEEYQKLQNQAREIGAKHIQPHLDKAGPVDTSAVVEHVVNTLKPGATSVIPGDLPFRSKLQQELAEWGGELTNGKALLTDPNKLHEVQSDMRRRAEELSANPETRRLGRQLYAFRDKLVNAIDKAAPGYKEGLEKYRDQMDIDRAFKFGQDMLKNSEKLEHDPSFVAQWVKNKDRTPEELAAARLGARQAVERKMGSIKSAALNPGRSGTDIPEIDFNRQKLEHLFGKENTEKMFKHLADERDIAVTNNRGLSNSTTAEAQAAQAVIKPREVSPPHAGVPDWLRAIGGGLGAGALTSNPTIGALVGGGLMGARMLKTGYDYAGRQMDLSRNASLANIISRNDPETIAGLVSAMKRIEKRNKLDNLIAPP